MNAYLAIDIGASSGRHILGYVEDGRIHLKETYRFDNHLLERDGHLCWDLMDLYAHVLEGIRVSGEISKPKTVGIDTWGVDFVLLDADDRVIGDTVSYRDSRTDGMDEIIERILPFEKQYEKSGIQKFLFNTIYQLMAIQKQSPDSLKRAKTMLLIPDYLNYLLTGVKRTEYTNASTTALLDAWKKDWNFELIEQLGFPKEMFLPISKPGSTVGSFSSDTVGKVGFDCEVLLPATHDTGSAFMAVPAKSGNAVYLSSGTWSLLGIERMEPLITEAGRKANFTNEGGYDYRYRYLKNYMGLWMIQSVRRDTGKIYSYGDIADMARGGAGYQEIVDVNDKAFTAPKNMADAVEEVLSRDGKPLPKTLGETLYCIYRSLAECYANGIRNLETITGKTFSEINIVGGGSQDSYLNELTAKATGLPVIAGPTEATAIGNLLAQMIAGGEFKDLSEARDAVAKTFEVKTFLP